ncbi:hypothetical protein D3C85_1696050 [compost metagenome]
MVPPLKNPVAKDLSFLGKYSAVALIAAGKFPASPNPNTALETINPTIETEVTPMPINPKTVDTPCPIGMAKACIIAPIDQIIMAHAYPFLVPSLSIIRPAKSMEMA